MKYSTANKFDRVLRRSDAPELLEHASTGATARRKLTAQRDEYARLWRLRDRQGKRAEAEKWAKLRAICAVMLRQLEMYGYDPEKKPYRPERERAIAQSATAIEYSARERDDDTTGDEPEPEADKTQSDPIPPRIARPKPTDPPGPPLLF